LGGQNGQGFHFFAYQVSAFVSGLGLGQNLLEVRLLPGCSDGFPERLYLATDAAGRFVCCLLLQVGQELGFVGGQSLAHLRRQAAGRSIHVELVTIRGDVDISLIQFEKEMGKGQIAHISRSSFS
jgi:hypothetical protein